MPIQKHDEKSLFVKPDNLLDINEYIGESFRLSETYQCLFWRKEMAIQCKKDKRIFCAIDFRSKKREYHTLNHSLHCHNWSLYCTEILSHSQTGEVIVNTRQIYDNYCNAAEYRYFKLTLDCNGAPSRKCHHRILSEIIIGDSKYLFVYACHYLFGLIGGREKISIINMDSEELISQHFDETCFTIHKHDVNLELLAMIFYVAFDRSIFSTAA